MKLKLKNFRCYKERNFELGNNGLTLISGMSGKGKSTILLAINFALFGKGTKLIKHGEKSCSVSLEFNNMKIVRTKRPNRLVVNDVYEDASGQSIIDKLFGNNFSITGYISQDSLNSFIMMSPTDKLAFLEKFALEDIDLSDKKGKCKALIKSRKEDLIAITSKLELSNEILDEMEKPEKVKFPIKTKNKEKCKKNETIRLKNCKTLIKKCNKSISKLEKEKSAIQLLESQTKNCQDQIDNLEDSLKKINEMLEHLQEIDEDLINDKKELLQKVLEKREYHNLSEKYEKDLKLLEEMKNNEMTELKNDIKNKKDSLWVEYEKNEIDQEINENKECLEDMKTLKKLKHKLKKYKKNMISEDVYNKNVEKLDKYVKKLELMKEVLRKLQLQKETYSCPKCSEILCFRGDKLEISNTVREIQEGNIQEVKNNIRQMKEDIDEITEENANYENNKGRYDEIINEIDIIENKYEEFYDVEELQDDIETLKEYKNDSLRIEKSIEKMQEKLKKQEFSASIQNFDKNLQKTRKKLKKANISEELNIDEEVLREEINELSNAKNEFFRKKQEKFDIKQKISALLTKKREFYEKFTESYEKARITNEIDNEILEKSQEIEDFERKILKHEDNLRKMQIYEKYKEELEKYKELENKVCEYNKDEKISRDKFTSAQTLLSKILEAESIAIRNVIENINTHVQYFLDKFFQEEPITIKLSAYKETKKAKKPQVNLEIDYKGMQCDINMLSGGERSRVILAFTLALGEMFNIPLLMLDESTASLDQDLTTVVFDGIRENFEKKLVIIIAHQIITGVFDRIINL